MKRYFGILTIITLATSFNNVNAQVDSTKAVDLFADLDKEAKKADANTTDYASATFKSTRVVNGHSI